MASTSAHQVTRAELAGMSPEAIDKAHREGRCRAVLADTPDDQILAERAAASDAAEVEEVRRFVGGLNDAGAAELARLVHEKLA